MMVNKNSIKIFGDDKIYRTTSAHNSICSFSKG